MNFASPQWLLALALLALPLAARVRASRQIRDAIGLLVSPRLRDDLVGGGDASKRSGWPRLLCLCSAFACVVFALARPQWGEIVREVRGEGRTVIIAIDTSRSMLATDLKPDRLTRAKLAAQDLIDALPEDLIGLMAFSGTAFLQVPITSDRSALSEAIEQLDTYAIARGGTNLANAIKLATSRFESSAAERHALILFTDGENLEGEAIDEAGRAAANGTVIIAIGVGSPEGAIIPNPDAGQTRDEFVRDKAGQIVRSKLDTETLEKLASASDGLFIHLDSTTMNSDLVRHALARLDTAETEAGSEVIPIERFPLPLGAGLLFLTLAIITRNLSVRRSPRPAAALAIGLAIATLSAPNTSRASAITEAYELYSSGDFEAAMIRYDEAIDRSRSAAKKHRLQLGMGSAAYRAGDHQKAISAFGNALVSNDSDIQKFAHYNLGNTLFRAGEARLTSATPPPEGEPPPPPPPEAFEATLRDWRGALTHFESTLAINPDHADATHNRDVVRHRIEELEKQQKQKQDQQKQKDDGKDEKEPPDKKDKKDNEQEGEESEGKGDKKEGDQAGEGQQKPPEDAGSQPGDQQQPDGRESEGEQAAASETPDPSEVINPETGYSEESARRQLEALANEQSTLRPLRRRRAQTPHFKDW